MKHPFIASLTNKTSCATCKRDYLSHTVLAHCEACDKIGECEIFGAPSNPLAMLLCTVCTENELNANSVSIAIADNSPSKYDDSLSPFASLSLPEDKIDVITESRRIDQNIRYAGDIFNAETIAIRDLSLAIDADETLSSQEKNHKLHALVLERIETYKPRIFELDNEKHELIAKQQAGIKFLRDFGNEVREEIRAKLKTADATYTIHAPLKAPKIVAPKKSPMERLIEAYALMKSCSYSEAEEMIKKGKT